MRKHFLILMLFALLPFTAGAESLTGKTIFKAPFVYTIVAAGSDYPNGKANVTVRKNDAGSQTQLTIPESFTEIVQGDEYSGEMTFTVVEIEANGFKDLDNLEKVVIPASVKTIGESAFSGDYSLSEVFIAPGSQLTSIGEYAFSAWITPRIDLSTAVSLETLPDRLFLTAAAAQNQYVKEVILPASIKDINTALAKLPALASVNIAETSLESLEEGALELNTKITELELPATLKTVAVGALKGTKVSKLTINCYQGATPAENIIGYDGNIYGTGDTNLAQLTELTFKGEFKGTIKANAFQGNTNLASVTFDAISGTIENGAFTANAKLATITMGDVKDGANIGAAFATTLEAGAALEMGNIGDATIADDAFKGLKSVVIGDIATVNHAIGDGAFAGKIASIETGAITGQIGGSFASTADAATLKIASIGADAVLADDAFTGMFTSIEITGALNGTVGASFVGNHTDGAALTIGSIGDANIGANAFKGLKSVEIGDIATVNHAIGAGAFAGAKLASIETGNITGKIGDSFASTLTTGATLKIASIGATADLADDAFTGKFTSIEITGALNGAVGASFVGSHADGAALTIGSIGDATIADDAFTGLKSVKVGDIATVTNAIGTGAFAGAKLASIETGNITGKIGASFSSTLDGGAALTIASIGEGASFDANAFKSINNLVVTNGISGGTFAEGSFVFVDVNNKAVNLGNISGGTFTADAITGPTTPTNKLELTIGNVSSALNTNLLTGSIKKATVGEISAAVSVEALGKAEEMVFGAVKTDGSITGAPAANTTLTKVTFGAVEVANGITATSFTNCTSLATVLFNGVLVEDAVAASAFKTAGAAATAATDGTKMTVTYMPTEAQLTEAFDQATFGTAAEVADGDRVVKLVTTQKFYEQYQTAAGYFYRVKASYEVAPETATIEFNGEAVGGYYYARLYVPKGEKAEITKTNGLTVYSAYTDGEDIYMNPLRVYGGKYQINGENALRAALIVKCSSNADIEYTKNAATTVKQSVQNYGDKYGILYNDEAFALTGAKITMEDGNFFKLTDASATKWSVISAAADHNSIVLVSNPEKSNSIKFADFDPTTKPTVKIAAGGYYLLVKKAATTAARNVVWLDEDGNTTAIQTVEKAVETANCNNAIYNLSGVRVSNASQKGIYIQNGKKFVVK